MKVALFFWLFDNFIVDIVRCLEPPGRYLKRQQWFTDRCREWTIVPALWLRLSIFAGRFPFGERGLKCYALVIVLVNKVAPRMGSVD